MKTTIDSSWLIGEDFNVVLVQVIDYKDINPVVFTFGLNGFPR